MANGKVLLPTALFLTITDSQKVGRELRFVSPSSTTGPVIRLTGKVDDYVVQLGPGATHTMTLDLSHYWAVATKQFPLQSSQTGAHRVVARLVGRGSTWTRRGDMALLKFWMGTAQSNETERFYVP